MAAFVDQRTWSQADLARKLETTTETIRKRLGELQAGGFKLERSEDPPQVYWSVPKNWFPGVLPFKADEARDLLRLLGRARASDLRDRLRDVVVARLSNLGHVDDIEFEDEAPANEHEDRWLSVVEDACRKKTVLKMRYFSASRRDERSRHASVHRIENGRHPTFIAICHISSSLRRFRVSNILEARLDPGEKLLPSSKADVERFESESLGGYRHEGPAVKCVFVVRSPESAWVVRNLPDPRITHAPADDGTRFEVMTSAIALLARFVVGLGGAAHAETPELEEAVHGLARGALST